jgi:adenylosuccinate synthase
MKNAIQSDIVIGLFLGDEGKGTTVDYLCSLQETNAVVRFSGGVQAAHNVITPEGLHHTFAQLGSGSFHKVRTILSRYMMVNPFSLVKEATKFYNTSGFDALSVALISENSLMTTSLHAAINKKREILRGANAHGSTGQGIGETQNYANHAGTAAPKMGDLKNLSVLFSKLDTLAAWAEQEVGNIWELIPALDDIKESYQNLAEDNILNIVSDEFISEELTKGYNVFEGSQGVLLDENFGFHPNTTWSTTTQKNAQTLLKEADLPQGKVIGITRTYGTRHGAGAFPSEFNEGTIFESYPELHNKRGKFQGAWRIGFLDLPLLEYAVKVTGGVDAICVTHLDIETEEVIGSYENFAGIPDGFFNSDRNLQEQFSQNLATIGDTKVLLTVTSEQKLLELIETACNSKVEIKSYGPTYKDKQKS